MRTAGIGIIAALLTGACSTDAQRESCDAVYAHQYGRLLIQASEDPSEPWRRAAYRSPQAWAHARAAAILEGARQSGRCR